MEEFKLDESAKKADIIKVARAAIQEVKKLRKQTDNTSADAMPYNGVGVIRNKEGFIKVDLKFDLDSNTAAISGIYEDKDRPEMAAMEADKALKVMMYSQREVLKEEKE